jgi:AcrR family transcriptional regulator
MGRHSDSSREKIIEAAEQVVIESGTRRLTMEAVSAKSGVSRGGILYHFRDKQALLTAMLDRFIERAKARRAQKREELPEAADREILAHLLARLEILDNSRQAGAATFFALAAHDPRLLSPIKEEYRKLLIDLTAGGLRFERAAIIALATDGLQLLELLLVSPFDPDERRRIIEELTLLAKDQCTQPNAVSPVSD